MISNYHSAKSYKNQMFNKHFSILAIEQITLFWDTSETALNCSNSKSIHDTMIIYISKSTSYKTTDVDINNIDVT